MFNPLVFCLQNTRSSSALEHEINFKGHYPALVTDDKKPVPSVDLTRFYQIQQAPATPVHWQDIYS